MSAPRAMGSLQTTQRTCHGRQVGPFDSSAAKGAYDAGFLAWLEAALRPEILGNVLRVRSLFDAFARSLVPE